MNILCSLFIENIFSVMEHCPVNHGLRFFYPIESIPVSKEIIVESQFVFSEELRIYEKYLQDKNGIPKEEKKRLKKLKLKLWKKEFLWKRAHVPPKKITTPCIFIQGPILLHPINLEASAFFIIELFCFKTYNQQKNEKRQSCFPVEEWREKASTLYSTTTCFLNNRNEEIIENIFKQEGYTPSIITKIINECGCFLRTKTWGKDCGFFPVEESNVISFKVI